MESALSSSSAIVPRRCRLSPFRISALESLVSSPSQPSPGGTKSRTADAAPLEFPQCRAALIPSTDSASAASIQSDALSFRRGRRRKQNQAVHQQAPAIARWTAAPPERRRLAPRANSARSSAFRKPPSRRNHHRGPVAVPLETLCRRDWRGVNLLLASSHDAGAASDCSFHHSSGQREIVDAVDQDERSGLPVVAIPVENQRMRAVSSRTTPISLSPSCDAGCDS